MKLRHYLVLRSIYTVITLWAISIIVFAATQVLPGNAASAILGPQASEERVAALEQDMGLNQPLHEQYLGWLMGTLRGDLGTGFAYNAPVIDVLVPRLIRSLELALVALVLTITISIPIGIMAALKKDSSIDSGLSTVTYIGVSMPEFVSGTLLLLLFAGPVFDIFPTSGYVPISDGFIPWLSHLILPAVTLSILLTAHFMRHTRAEMVSTLQEDYVRTARLKGMGEYKVVVSHALRNALIPTITVIAINTGWLLGSIVVVEEIFAYPGLGRMLLRAIELRDMPVVQATMIVVAAAYILSNVAADILYSYLDPRIEYGES